jgi:hypothetical protein
MFFITSCRHSSEESLPEEESTLLNEPTDEVTATMGNKTFTVDFRINDECLALIPETMEQLKTRNDLIDLFKSVSPGYLMPDNYGWGVEQSYAFRIEYMLAQECFSNDCTSEIRRDILQLMVANQKAGIRNYHPYCARKSGIFLMAVILLKENISEKYIYDETLQQALSCLNTDTDGVSGEFSNLIIDCCEKFLNKYESVLLHEPIDKVTATVGDKDFTVNFRFDTYCQGVKDYFYTQRIRQLKTRDDLIDYYEPYINASFTSSYDPHVGKYTESMLVKIEYMLAQECFSNDCESEIRKEVLRLVVAVQKAKYDRNREASDYYYCFEKTGVFLMAVILLKERDDSAKFIDDDTLQQALLCLNVDTYGVDEEFSNLIIDCSEKFLNEPVLLRQRPCIGNAR